MFMKKNLNNFWWIVFAAGLIAIDQFTKYVAVHNFNDSVLYNIGSAFSMPIPTWIIFLITLIYVGVSIYFFRKETVYSVKLTWVFIFCGAVSNFVDRVRIGKVIDFIDLHFWPVFNVADVFLSVGALMLLYYYVIKK